MPDISRRVHLTKRMVDATEPTDVDVLVRDDDVRGVGLRVKPNGTTSHVLQDRSATGRSRRVTIGPHGVLTAEGARATLYADLKVRPSGSAGRRPACAA